MLASHMKQEIENIVESSLNEEDEEVDPDGFEIEEMEAGDEFMACKPWLGAMKAPTDFKPDNK